MPPLQSKSRLEPFLFSNLESAFSDLAFNVPNRHGASPRMNPLINSLDHIDKLGGKTIVRQHTVQDPDFFSEYYAYYSRVFGDTDKYCHRMHFFSMEMNPDEDVLDFIDRAAGNADSYLGFITVRPVRSSPVAATILRPLPNQHFLLSSDVFDVHLAGRKFLVRGTPFMQQDNAVGACAQASIWMALRTLRKKEGNSAFDPAQITSAATRFLVRGRTLPNREGLGIDQMIEAIRFAGYSPHLMQFSTANPQPGANNHLVGNEILNAKRKIYAYVESEIPVVLGVFPSPTAGHAVVLIGHTWNVNNNATPYFSNSDLKLYHAADWVTSFISHNDNTGPYLELPETGGNDYCFEQARFSIPLLPSDVFMSGEEAEQVANKILIDLLQLNQLPTSTVNTAQEVQKFEDLVIRTYLVERHRFREWVTDKTDIHIEVKNYYRLKILPKRIWVTEVCLLKEHNNTRNGSLSRVGEILIDPTGEPNDAPFLSIHLNISAIAPIASGVGVSGVIIDREADGQLIKYIPLQTDTCYSSLSR